MEGRGRLVLTFVNELSYLQNFAMSFTVEEHVFELSVHLLRDQTRATNRQTHSPCCSLLFFISARQRRAFHELLLLLLLQPKSMSRATTLILQCTLLIRRDKI